MRNACNRGQQGFTLVELMVVLVIIGLLTSLTVLTFPKNLSPAEDLATHMATILGQAAEDSVISGNAHAMAISNTEYAIYHYQQGQWLEIRRWDIDPYFRIKLVREHMTIDLLDKLTPLLIFDPTGLNTHFHLTITGEMESYRIHSSDVGLIKMEQF